MNGPDDRSEGPASEGPGGVASPDLDAAYARASHADGSRPSLSARASILANAQREAATRAAQIADAAGPGAERIARRIGPAAAANDSWWNWRAAAGFVGVGFAGVMALWLYRGNQEPAPAAAPRPSQVASPQRATERAAEKAVEAAAEQAVRNDAFALSVDTSAASKAGAPMAAARALAPAPPRAVAPSAESLLQRWFPQALESDAERQQYWFVLDRNGAALRSGQREWSNLTELQRWLTGAAADLRIARMESKHFTNRRGRDVELAYAWAESD